MLPRHHLCLQPSRCRYRKHIQCDIYIHDNINLLFFQKSPQFPNHRKISRPRIDPFPAQAISVNFRLQRIKWFLLLFRQTYKADIICTIFLQCIGNLHCHTLCASTSRDVTGKKTDFLSHCSSSSSSSVF